MIAGRTKWPREIDDRADELAGFRSRRRSSDHKDASDGGPKPAPVPTAANAKPVASSTARSCGASTASASRRNSSTAVEAQIGRGLAACFEIVPEHERATAGLGNKTDCDGRTNHNRGFSCDKRFKCVDLDSRIRASPARDHCFLAGLRCRTSCGSAAGFSGLLPSTTHRRALHPF